MAQSLVTVLRTLKDLSGQDLLAQSRTGLVWLNGNGGEAPTPMGLAVADMLAGHFLLKEFYQL